MISTNSLALHNATIAHCVAALVAPNLPLSESKLLPRCGAFREEQCIFVMMVVKYAIMHKIYHVDEQPKMTDRKWIHLNFNDVNNANEWMDGWMEVIDDRQHKQNESERNWRLLIHT